MYCKFKKIFTLVFVRRNSEVLLGHKARGFGVGLWNGFGGKVEKDETIAEGAARELKEESNLEGDLKQIGLVRYHVQNKELIEDVHIFTTDSYKCEIIESEEMSPIQWYDLNKLPYEKMWPDASSWVPLLLDDCYFVIDVTYGKEDVITQIKKQVFNEEKTFFKCINIL